MASITHIIKSALKDAGIYLSEGDSVPADYLNPCFDILKNVINELNAQTSIIFSQKRDDVNVVGDKLTFKKYTEDEQAIIDGGGSVDITDRLIDFVPCTNPVVYYNGYHLNFVSYRDLIDNASSELCAYTFNVDYDSSEIIFNAPVCGQISILRNVPIEMDEEPFGDLYVPKPYEHYIITKLTEAVALRFQDKEGASIYAQKADKKETTLANNNTSRKPVKMNLMAGLNKFRKYG